MFAAMDTTSNVLARLLHCLAQHPDIQRKLRAEVVETFPDGELQYDRLLALPYMDAVCRETLRLCVLLHFLGGSSYVERSMIFRYTPSLWLGRTYGILFSSCSGTNYRDSAKRDTVLPLSRPVRRTDGRLSVELAVPAGTEVSMGVHGCNTSKEFWGEDAMDWKPERWLSPLPKSITDAGMPSVMGSV